jgi:2'-5' RNA ligase
MRLFFALEPLPEIALQIADWRDRQLAVAGKPVPAANFHITLAFLGDLKPQAVEQLCSHVDDYLERSQASRGELELNQVGYWPKPGIYWLGPERWPESLNRLVLKLQSLGTAVGAKRSRGKFQPHITLFRRCEAPPPAPVEAPKFHLPLAEFTLFESKSGKQGVSYHPLEHWLLPRASH